MSGRKNRGWHEGRDWIARHNCEQVSIAKRRRDERTLLFELMDIEGIEEYLSDNPDAWDRNLAGNVWREKKVAEEAKTLQDLWGASGSKKRMSYTNLGRRVRK